MVKKPALGKTIQKLAALENDTIVVGGELLEKFADPKWLEARNIPQTGEPLS